MSKTSLLKGMQCPKALYLYKYHFDKRDPVTREQQDKFSRGHQVGLLARELFPGGIDCSPPSVFQYEQSIAATKALVMQQYPVIYEAAFRQDGLLIANDILCCREGKWYAYEVKSSGKITSTYLQDAAIQYYVMQQSGLVPEDFYIVHIDTGYVRQGDLSVSELFRIISVKEEVLELQPVIRNAISRAVDVLLSEQIPDTGLGVHCYRPYACDFLGTCWRGKEKSPVMQLGGVPIQEKIEWVLKGITRLEDLPEQAFTTERLRVQAQAHSTGQEYVQKEELRNFFSSIRYPLYFFDIEAFQPAIPPFDHTCPFQPIPFQFSALYVEREDGPRQTFELIVPPGEDGRKAFTEAFIEATHKPGQIVVFNTLLEKGILYHLGKLFPEHAAAIHDRLKRMVDLEIPFRNDWYYHPGMQGGYSMKNILPALVPGLSYEQISIRDGMDAMYVYQQLMHETDPAKKIKGMQDLLAYCQMDTLGLYEVFRYLEKVVKRQ